MMDTLFTDEENIGYMWNMFLHKNAGIITIEHGSNEEIFWKI